MVLRVFGVWGCRARDYSGVVGLSEASRFRV